MISPAHLYRLAAAAAILGGAARIFASFPLMTGIALEWLYIAIDVALTFGLIGIYVDRAPRLGFLGLASFAVAIAALNFIGGPDADTFGFSTYGQGAAVLAIAMVGLSIAWLRASERPLTAPLCWFASVIAGGVLSMIPIWEQNEGALVSTAVPLVIAGVLFGAGFVSAGVDLFRRT